MRESRSGSVPGVRRNLYPCRDLTLASDEKENRLGRPRNLNPQRRVWPQESDRNIACSTKAKLFRSPRQYRRRQHADSERGSMPSNPLLSDQGKCLFLTSPLIEPGDLWIWVLGFSADEAAVALDGPGLAIVR